MVLIAYAIFEEYCSMRFFDGIVEAIDPHQQSIAVNSSATHHATH